MDAKTYDLDFITWTEQQAAALRATPLDVTALDTERLAEEIEDMGKQYVREVSSFLTQTLSHLLKLHLDPHAPAAQHWLEEVIRFQTDAMFAFTPGIKQRLDLGKIWRKAKKSAAVALAAHRVQIPELPDECPLPLEAMLDEDFDPKVALQIFAAAIR